MKPFDLEAAKRGEPICLRTGKPVKFIAYIPEARKEEQLVILNGDELLIYQSNGIFDEKQGSTCLDLFMAPRKRTVWVNLYPSGCSGEWFYESQSDANTGAEENRIGGRAWPLEIEE